MTELALSIVTINYQNVAGLRATMDSVLSQIGAKDSWEWILIDGGSTDGSLELIKGESEHIAYWCSEPDKGIYDAMNKGLQRAKGKFVWFLNSADRLHGTDAIARILGAIDAHAEADCFYSDTYFVDADYRQLGLISKLKPQRFPEKLSYESFRFGMNICHQSFVVRRSLAPQYSLKYRQASDIDWILEILKGRPKCMRIEGVLSEFQVGGSSSAHASKAMKERYAILQRHFGFLPNLFAHAWIFIRRFLFRGI